MSQGQRPPITELGALLDALCVNYWGSTKTRARIERISSNELVVVENFDDGKGHSGALSSRRTKLDPAIFEEAKSLRYIQGKLEPGYVSDSTFLLTNDPSLLQDIYRIGKKWNEEDFERRIAEHRRNHPIKSQPNQQ